MNKLALAAGLTTTAIAGAAFGTDFVTDGNNVDMSGFDDLYDGTIGSMVSLTVLATDVGALTDVNVTVDIAHTWAGDLTMKLQSPSGTLISLVSRAGYAEPADDGSGCCGESSDLVFGNIYTFDDAAASSSETMGSGGEDPIASFSLFSSGFGTDHGLTSLNGESSAGVWTLYIGDGAAGDVGVFDGFTLSLSGVPAPGALALLGLAGLAGTRRRRA